MSSLRIYAHLFSFEPRQAINLCKKLGIGYEITLNAQRLDYEFNELIKLAQKWHCSAHAPVLNLDIGAMDYLILQSVKTRLKQVVHFSESAKCKWIVIHTGYHYILHRGKFYKKWVNIAKNTLCEIATISKFPIHVENVDEPSPQVFIDLLNGTDNKVFFCFDIGHAYAFSREKKLKTWIETLGSFIREVHLHENPGTEDSHEPPGSGYISNLNELLCLIEDYTDKFIITLEPRDENDLIKGMKWLKENGWM